jgi:hypothetical protein
MMTMIRPPSDDFLRCRTPRLAVSRRSGRRAARAASSVAVERLEPRLALANVGFPPANPAVILGSGAGQPVVQVLDPATGAERVRFLAYESSFRGGVRVFGADVTGDGIDEILVAPGPGRVGEIRVFTHTGIELPAYRTRPFGDRFLGGVEVAAGPVTAPGRIDIVAAQETQGSLVRVFAVTTGAADPVADVAVRQFQPFGTRFVRGARLTTADIGTFSGGAVTAAAPDGVFEILVSSRPGMPATVVAHDAVPVTTPRIATFNPLSATAASGVFVARLPGAGGMADRILVSGGVGSRSRVETWRYETSSQGRQSFVRDAAFAAFLNRAAAVVAAAVDEAAIFTVRNGGGMARGVRLNTSLSGGKQTTLPASADIGRLPQRIAIARQVPGADSVTLTTDFRQGTGGWVSDVADLPSGDRSIYELDSGLRPLPAEVGPGTGYMLQGTNRSDDLFMYVKRQLDSAFGIVPNGSYRLRYSITLASNAPSNAAGVGGAPGESVFLKAGGSTVEPIAVTDEQNSLRLNVDKGDQALGGRAASVAGNIANGLQPDAGAGSPYVSIVREVTHEVDVVADAQGRLWLFLGTDSGFEGQTRIYLQQVTVQVSRQIV